MRYFNELILRSFGIGQVTKVDTMFSYFTELVLGTLFILPVTKAANIRKPFY